MFGFLRRRGNRAEDFAAEALTARGYRVVERNVSIGGGELDIVAWDGVALVAVEVKARQDDAFGTPEEALGRGKAVRVAKAFAAYLRSRRLEVEVEVARIDLAAVSLGPDGAPLGVDVLVDVVDIASALRGGRWQR